MNSIRKIAGTGLNETWRDTGFEGKIGRDGRTLELSTGPQGVFHAQKFDISGVDTEDIHRDPASREKA